MTSKASIAARDNEMKTLRQVLHLDSSQDQEYQLPTFPVIYITGPSSTGKSLVCSTLLSGLEPGRVAWNHCIERYQDQLLYSHILNQFSNTIPSFDNGFECYAQPKNLNDFHVLLLELLDASKGKLHYLVLDHVDRLCKSPTLFSYFTQLYELSHGRICVLMISRCAWQDMMKKCHVPMQPFILDFQLYKKQEIQSILALDCPMDQDKALYQNFVNLLYETFHLSIKDLDEWRHLISLLFPKYMEPIKQGKLKRNQTSQLAGYISEFMKEAGKGLYLHHLSSHELVKGHIHRHHQWNDFIDLPFYTKYLLIACYLASFNPAKLDGRFFSKSREETRQKKRHYGIQKSSRIRHQLLGPSSFTLERLMGIFYAIVDEPIEDSISISKQVTTLISLGLVTRTSQVDRLEGMRLKCCASYQMVKRIGLSIRMDISKYLYDWIDAS